jgi:hypothetical protein
MILTLCIVGVIALIALMAWDERRARKKFERDREIHRLSFAPRMVVHGHGAFAYEAGAARTPQAQPGAPRNIPYEAWIKAGVDPVLYSQQCERGLHGPNPPALMPPA